MLHSSSGSIFEDLFYAFSLSSHGSMLELPVSANNQLSGVRSLGTKRNESC